MLEWHSKIKSGGSQRLSYVNNKIAFVLIYYAKEILYS